MKVDERPLDGQWQSNIYSHPFRRWLVRKAVDALEKGPRWREWEPGICPGKRDVYEHFRCSP